MRDSAEILEALFENAPNFVARLSDIAAESWSELLFSAEQMALAMPATDQLELLNGHPRIGARPASVSASSYSEQGYDRDLGTAELQDRLDRLNEAYERKFGFRFVVFVAGRSREQIAGVMESRMSASREEELERALADVFAIARDRLTRLAPASQEVR